MKIIAHRGNGFGKCPNSIEAFSDCVSAGFGIETDFRDYCGELVVSHNIADAKSPRAELAFEEFAKSSDAWFAVNIKADDCARLIKKYIEKYRIQNYFCFDMSIPQSLDYIKNGLNCFTRQSEYEKMPALYEDSVGIWLDGFFCDNWITEEIILRHIQNKKQVCVVSPELHGRQHIGFWEKLLSFHNNDYYMLCTDFPIEANRFFNGYLKSGERRQVE